MFLSTEGDCAMFLSSEGDCVTRMPLPRNRRSSSQNFAECRAECPWSRCGGGGGDDGDDGGDGDGDGDGDNDGEV